MSTELTPCPFCGTDEGYNMLAGSTFRWWLQMCTVCGEQVSECRADPVMPHNAPLPNRWVLSDAAWNSAGKHAQGLRDEIAKLRSALILASGALSMVSPCAVPDCQAEQLEWLEDAKKAADLALAKEPT